MNKGGKKVGGGEVTGPVRLPFARKRKEKKKGLNGMPPHPFGTGLPLKHMNTHWGKHGFDR